MVFWKHRLGQAWTKYVLIFGALAAAVVAWAPPAAWAQSCTTTICTGSATACSISGTHTLTDGCTLNFGTTDVTINSNGKLTVADNSHTYSVVAGSLVVRGELEGGGVSVTVDDGFTTEVVSNSPGRIDINSTASVSQTFHLSAGGAVLIDGKSCDADATSVTQTGTIDLNGDSITILEPCTAKGAGGNSGGYIWMAATNAIDVSAPLEADGGGTLSDGGWVYLDAGTTLTTNNRILANGTGGGDGGDVDMFAGGAVDVNDDVNLNAGSGGADGGEFSVTAGGAVTIDGALDLNASADGSGGSVSVDTESSFSTTSSWVTNAGNEGTAGDIDIVAGTSVATTSTGILRATGGGDAGFVTIDAGTTATIEGLIDTQAGGDGLSAGDVDISGGGNVTISGEISADATAGPDAWGALVTISSGGDVSISSTIDAGAAGADSSSGDITVTADSGVVDISGTLTADVGTSGWDNGDIVLSGCEVEVSGVLDTRTAGGPGGGINRVDYRNGFILTGDMLADSTAPDGNYARCKCVDLDSNGCDMPLACEVNPNTSGGVLDPSPLVVTPVSFPAC